MSAHAMTTPNRPQCFMSRWQPASLVTSDIIILKLILGVTALVRADDYAHGVADSYGVLESAFPLWVWAGVSYLVGACILAGIAWQRHGLVWLGHAAGAGLYGVLALASAASAFSEWPPRAGAAASTVPPQLWVVVAAALAVTVVAGAFTARGYLRTASRFAAALGVGAVTVGVVLANAPADGLRGAGPLGVVCALHTLLMLRSGPRPMSADEGAVVEETTAPEGD